MKKNHRKNLIALLSLLALTGIGAGSTIAKSNVSAATNSTPVFGAGTRISGAQLRLDEGTRGMRFVLEMNSADYEAYKTKRAQTTEQADAGVLIMPTNAVENDGLNINTDDVENIEFADDYVATLDNGVYNFYAVLTEIPAYTYQGSFTAVGYLYDGAKYIYTDPVERTVEFIAEDYLLTYGEGSDKADATKLQCSQNYVLDGYNAKNAKADSEYESYESYEAMVEALLEESKISFNKANAILFNDKDGEKLNAKLSQNDYFDVKYEVIADDSVYKEAPITVTESGLVEVVEGLRGTATVKASILNGTIAKSLRVTVADETLMGIGEGLSHYEASGYVKTANTTVVYDNNKTPDDPSDDKTVHNAVNYGLNHLKVANNIVDSKASGNILSSGYATDYTNLSWVNEVAGESVNALKWHVPVGMKKHFAMNFDFDYNYDTIAMFLAAGYDRIILPIYAQIDENTLATSEQFNGDWGTVDFLTVSTPNKKFAKMYESNPTGSLNVQSAGFSIADARDVYGAKTISRIYFNEWTNVQIDLQVFYDCYEVFFNNGSFSDSSAQEILGQTLLSFYNVAKNGTVIKDYEMDLYFGNIRLSKAQTTVTDGYLNLSAVDAGIVNANNGYHVAGTEQALKANAAFAGGTSQIAGWDGYGLNRGIVTPYFGKINGETSKNGGAWLMSPRNREMSAHDKTMFHAGTGVENNMFGRIGNVPGISFFADESLFGVTLESLKAMDKAGKKNLEFKFYAESLMKNCTNNSVQIFTLCPGEMNSGYKTAYNYNLGDNAITITIAIDDLIDNFDACFAVGDMVGSTPDKYLSIFSIYKSGSVPYEVGLTDYYIYDVLFK